MTIGRKYTQRIKDHGLSRLLDHRTRCILDVIRRIQKEDRPSSTLLSKSVRRSKATVG